MSCSSPDDHLAARPHRRVPVAPGGRAGGRHRRPTVSRWIVAPAVVQNSRWCSISSPDDHLAARPHRRVPIARGGRAGGGHRRPTVSRRIVAPAVVEIAGCRCIRPRRSSRCPSIPPCANSARRARRWSAGPSNCWRLDCSARRRSNSCCRVSAPDDHLAAVDAVGSNRPVRWCAAGALFPNVAQIHLAQLHVAGVEEIAVAVVAGQHHPAAGQGALTHCIEVRRRCTDGQLAGSDGVAGEIGRRHCAGRQLRVGD